MVVNADEVLGLAYERGRVALKATETVGTLGSNTRSGEDGYVRQLVRVQERRRKRKRRKVVGCKGA